MNYFDIRGYEKLIRALDVRAIELGFPSKRNTAQTRESFQAGEDVIDNKYPLSFSDLVTALKNRYPDFKVNKRFFEIKKELENSDKYCEIRYLNESDKYGIQRKFYSTEILKVFDKCHREIELSSQKNVTEQRITGNQILIIDADSDIRKLLAIYIGSEFSTLTSAEASDAIEAVEQIILQNPCIVILDLLLPGSEGYDVLEFLDSQFEEALIIVTSSRPVSKLDIISNYENIHSWQIEVIQKPPLIENLGVKIRSLLSSDEKD